MVKPVRVLQCFGIMGRGGAETLIMNIYRNIDRAKLQFDFVVHREQKSSFDDEIYDMGGHIYKVPPYTLTNHLQYRKAWDHLFRDNPHKWPIIHGHMFTTAATYLGIAKKHGLITIAHSHSVSSGIGFPARIKDILQYPIRYNQDYYFACSHAAGRWLFGDEVVHKDNYYLLKNAIDVKSFKYNSERRRANRQKLALNDEFIIGHIGNFLNNKNHLFLVNIFREVCKKKPKAALMLIGDGPLRGLIMQKVQDYGLTDRIIFTGIRSDIPDLMQTMDVFVFPSLFEGLPVTLIEAQAAGLPCIISDNITQEVDITNLVERESLNSPVNIWADRILKYEEGYDRTDPTEIIKNAGYDIIESAEWLQRFYLNLGNDQAHG